MCGADDVHITRCTPFPTERCTSFSRMEELLKDLHEQMNNQKEITQELTQLKNEKLLSDKVIEELQEQTKRQMEYNLTINSKLEKLIQLMEIKS